MRNIAIPVLFALMGAATPAVAQDAAAAAKSPYLSVIGTVDKVDSAAKVLAVKPEKGDNTTVRFDEKTAFMLLPAGEKDTKKATPGTAADVGEGDHVLARVLTADPTGKPARTIYVEKQADLAKRNEATLEEWKNATSGLVTAIDAGAKQVRMTAKLPGTPAPKEIMVDLSGRVQFQHYNPDTGKYEPSTMAAIKMGDQVRVLGQKNADSTEIKAENIGSGSFKTIGVQVKSIDAAANQIQGIETGSKKPIVIALRSDTSLKKFDDVSAMMVARQLNPTYQQAGGRGRGGAGGGAPGTSMPPQGVSPAGPGGPGGGRPFGGGRGRNMDIGKLIEQQPSIQLSDLKPNDAVIVTGATGADPSRITATALVAGVEPILRAAPNNGADPLAGSWSMGAGGGDAGN
jgi:hypothetical protein